MKVVPKGNKTADQSAFLSDNVKEHNVYTIPHPYLGCLNGFQKLPLKSNFFI